MWSENKRYQSRWSEIIGVADPWDTRVRQGYVEAGMDKQNQNVWDAYLSIDVKSKDGYENIPKYLPNYLKGISQYQGLKSFFDKNKDKEVWLTDDVVSLREARDVYNILHAIIGKDVLVHLRVDYNQVQNVQEYLDEIVEEESISVV